MQVRIGVGDEVEASCKGIVEEVSSHTVTLLAANGLLYTYDRSADSPYMFKVTREAYANKGVYRDECHNLWKYVSGGSHGSPGWLCIKEDSNWNDIMFPMDTPVGKLKRLDG